MEWYLLGITLMTEGSRIQSANLLSCLRVQYLKADATATRPSF